MLIPASGTFDLVGLRGPGISVFSKDLPTPPCGFKVPMWSTDHILRNCGFAVILADVGAHITV